MNEDEQFKKPLILTNQYFYMPGRITIKMSIQTADV